MTEDGVTIPTPDGPMAAFRALPARGEPAPAVLVFAEAYGVDDHIESVCRRFARAGYVAIAPELYHREGRGITAGYDDFDRVRPLLATLTNAGIEIDARAALAFLRSDAAVSPTRIAAVGFCIGGFAAFLAACRTDVAASICFYGGGIAQKRPGRGIEPLLDEAGAIARPVLAFFGADDTSIPAADVDAISERLHRLGKTFEIVVYPEAGHGFFNDARTSYRADAAVDAWNRTLVWLASHLGEP
jgi:carboxymethylenebutenolidase